MEAHRGTTVVCEMGTGKTFIVAAHMAGFRRILDPGANLMEVMEQQVNLD